MKLGQATLLSFLVSAQAVAAQETINLETITVESGDTAGEGFFGPSIPQDTAGVTKTGETIMATPRSVSVITQEQINERGATSVEQALQYAPGVVAGQWGLDNRSDWSNIRGFAPSTYHDGLQSRFGYYNDTKPETFLLDSVAALKGPASALYGNGSVGGVVDTTSKIAGQPADNIVQLQYGSHNRKQIGVDFSDTLSDGRLSYRIVGLWRDSDTQVDHTQDNSLAFAPSIAWRATDRTTVKLLFNYQKTETQPLIQFASAWGTLYDSPYGGRLPDSLFVGEPGFDKLNTEQTSVTAMVEHDFENGWTLDARLRHHESESDYNHAWWAYDNYDNYRYNADGTINRTFYSAHNTLEDTVADVNLKGQWALNGVRMKTLLGASYSRALYDSDYGYGEQIAPIDPYNPVYAGYPDIDQTDYPASTVEEYGVYATNRATFGERLHVDLGLRWAHIETGETSGTFTDNTVSAKDDAWSKSFAILYEAPNGMSPYLSYAESFTQEVAGTDAEGNQFEPTEGKQWELGLKYQMPGTRSILTVAAFDLTKSNLAITDPTNPGFQIQTGEANVKGLELGAKHDFGEVSVDFGFSWLDTENSDGYRIATVPENFGSLWVNYTPDALPGWRFGAGVRYVGAAWDGSDAQKTPSYTLYDAMVGYQTERFDAAFTVRNLTDEYYVNSCGSGACYIGEGRTAALTLTTKF
ncbi:TonB-dependent siderophore receptor [Maritimibacter alkaliphilus]|uniref:TonB-dependent siderophore receptor n=1 Tax=Maritimibacter alkaliphilus TaxID=404236 RepID=UPI0028F6EB29|nr:TonB-dependent siderophore receptor [Maritimibacter alkaliphilus]